ncbi:hypothetical protein TNCV_3503681 [Trichonephila clavipes]|uniref:Uncharacterized protein n=1 Tax=Trichonephila clavipes TaxID=2585209 RepID=A0A8X6S424_TRICX|nr:hypothetical protein TNCV_3503681 [Trichonephila clavipes]
MAENNFKKTNDRRKHLKTRFFSQASSRELGADFREAREQPKQSKNTKGSLPKSTTDAYQLHKNKFVIRYHHSSNVAWGLQWHEESLNGQFNNADLFVTLTPLLTWLINSTAESGHGRLVVKVTDTWPACYEFEPRTVGDPPCRGAMYVKSVYAQTSWVRQHCCRPRHLIMVQNYEVFHQ